VTQPGRARLPRLCAAPRRARSRVLRPGGTHPANRTYPQRGGTPGSGRWG